MEGIILMQEKKTLSNRLRGDQWEMSPYCVSGALNEGRLEGGVEEGGRGSRGAGF